MRNGLIVDEDGPKTWYQNNLLHREDGPAVEHPDGTKVWYQNNQLHRTDGPAVEYADGVNLWFLKDVEHDFNEWLERVDTCTEVEKTMIRLQYT